VSANATLQADPKTVLSGRIFFCSGQAVVFRSAKRVLVNRFPVLQAAPEIEQRFRMAKQRRSSAMGNGAVDIWADAVPLLETVAKAVYAIRIA
jgi:hypothetical protein